MAEQEKGKEENRNEMKRIMDKEMKWQCSIQHFKPNVDTLGIFIVHLRELRDSFDIDNNGFR